MIHDRPATEPPFETRMRWRRIGERRARVDLRVALLASYTIDPLVPYLGAALHDAGIEAELRSGPFDQIAQECLDPDSGTARFEPHVVVVAPRFEELCRTGTPDTARVVSGVTGAVDAAVAAAHRWEAGLAVVVPAVAHAGLRAGVAAAARAGREALLSRLDRLPSVWTVDLDAVLREFPDPLHHELYRLARIPYREEVFAALGRRLARLLELCHHGPCMGILVDADSVLAAVTARRDRLPGECLRVLAEARALGIRIAVRGGGVAAAARVLGPLADRWLAGDDPVEAQLDRLAAGLGGVRAVRLVTADLALAERAAAAAGPGSAVLLGDDTATWHRELVAAGLLDRLPVVRSGSDRTAPLSLEAYIDSLEVELSRTRMGTGEVPATVDLVRRTQDFTLGVEPSERDLLRAADDPDARVWLVDVRDRYGGYGTAAIVGVRARDRACEVTLFEVTCPVLGRGVERRLLAEVGDWAGKRGCDRVEVRFRRTGRNHLALEFFERVGRAGGIEVRLVCLDEQESRMDSEESRR